MTICAGCKTEIRAGMPFTAVGEVKVHWTCVWIYLNPRKDEKDG